MSKRGPKPKSKVKILWSAPFAYAIGLIVSDGSLSKDGRHISLVSKDVDQLQNFCKSLDILVPIRNHYSGSKSLAYHIQFSDVIFYGFLLSIGITTAKSLTLGKIDIPDEYFADFLRGCFDGDGCSYSYWDPRWKSSFMFYISFASGSLNFINWLQQKSTEIFSLHGHISVHMKKNGKNNYYQLKFSKYEAIKLANFLYKKKGSIKLSRKYLKIKESLGIVRKQGKRNLDKNTLGWRN